MEHLVSIVVPVYNAEISLYEHSCVAKAGLF